MTAPKKKEASFDDLFVSSSLQVRDVKLPDGSAHRLHFREVDYAEFVRFMRDRSAGDDEVRIAAPARLIAASLRNPDGGEAITTEKALTLKAAAMNALLSAVLDVNGMSGRTDESDEGNV